MNEKEIKVKEKIIYNEAEKKDEREANTKQKADEERKAWESAKWKWHLEKSSGKA